MAATIQCPACNQPMAEQSDGFYVNAEGTLIYTNTYRCQPCNRQLTIEAGPHDTSRQGRPNALTVLANTQIEHSNDASCELCIDGHMPAGEAIHIGPIYIACTNCSDPCPNCDGDAMFPANWRCPHCFIEAMVSKGYDPQFCPACAGVTAVIPISTTPSDV